MAENLSAEARTSDARPTPADLVIFVPYACVQLQATFSVTVLKIVQDEYVSKTEDKNKKMAKGKSTISHQASYMQRDSQDKEDESLAGPGILFADPNEIVITAVFDVSGRLVELQFNKTHAIPRMLIKIIAMCIPYQMCMTRLTMCRVPLKGEIIYEIVKFLPLSRITELLLEDSPVPQHNYYMLFDFAHLKRVSLVRCGLTDDDCVGIASKLVHPQPVTKTLTLLSLACNKISDVGACALGQALRSNRTLQYLNLSGNRITDIGAKSILESLIEFSLTYKELLTKRERMLEHMRLKQTTFKKCFKELSAALAEKSFDEVSRVSRRKTTARPKKVSASSIPFAGTNEMDAIAFKAEIMTNELVGILNDPFSADEVELKGNQVYCLGNTVLCYLNLSYNNLGYESVVDLFEVLAYQNKLTRKSGPGLLRVVIEGNNMPANCFEYFMIDELLDKAVSMRTAKPPRKAERGRSRGK